MSFIFFFSRSFRLSKPSSPCLSTVHDVHRQSQDIFFDNESAEAGLGLSGSLWRALRLFLEFGRMQLAVSQRMSYFLGCSLPFPSTVSFQKTHQQVPMTHVLLLADTQIQHPALFAEGSWWSNSFRHILFELNLRKSWRVTSRLKPDAVIFLGDMLSNGKGARSSEA